MGLEWTPEEPVGLVLETCQPNRKWPKGEWCTGKWTKYTGHVYLDTGLLWLATTGSKLSRTIPTNGSFGYGGLMWLSNMSPRWWFKGRHYPLLSLICHPCPTSEGTRMTCLQFCVLQGELWEAEWGYGICNHASAPICRTLCLMEKQLTSFGEADQHWGGMYGHGGGISGIIHSRRK